MMWFVFCEVGTDVLFITLMNVGPQSINPAS